jgi:hypothetical protein
MATRVQIAFDLSATSGITFFTLDDNDAGVLDNTVYLLGGEALVDVTQYVREFSVQRGRSTTLQKFTAGQANVTLDNRSRIFDPTFTTGTYFGQILPRKQIVIDRDGETIYTGLVEDWNFNYDYRRVPEDCTVGAFTDGDSFGGGTNGYSHRVSAGYQVAKSWNTVLSYFLGKTGIMDGNVKLNRQLVQADLNVKF